MAAPNIVSYDSEKVIDMNKSTFARPITIPAAATRIRVGIRHREAYAGPGGPLYIGLVNGTTNILGDATVDNFIGGGYPWIYWNGSYSYNNAQLTGYKKEGVTDGSVAMAPVQSTAMNTGVHPVTLIDMWVSSSGVVGLQGFYPNNNGNLTSDQFLGQMVLTTPSFTGQAWGSAVTLAATTTNFFSNRSLNVYWGSTTPIYIYDLAVSVIA